MTAMRLTFTAVEVARELLKTPNARRYGTDLQKALNMTPGTLYPILDRMRARQWIADQWEDPAEARNDHPGPPRRYHTVTESGKAALSEMVQRWDAQRSKAN